VYTVTPTANGCAGTPVSVTITVNPAPTVTATPASQAICSGTPTGISLSGSMGGTTFTWTVVQTNVSGASAGSGSSIAQTLTATSTTAGTAVYTITPTANGCPGTPINVTITVNPSPVVTATPASQTICSGTAPSIALTSNIAGTTYAWTVAQTNVSGASAGTGSSIGQTLTATTSAAGTAVYTVTPTANGCAGNPITVTITVNPPPVATATPASQTICSGSASSIALSSTIGGTTYSWTVVQTNISGATSGSGSNIAQTLTTTTTSAGTAVYTITPMAGTCGGSPITVTINVNPRPVATATPSSQTICSGNNTGIALSSNMAGTTYSWTVTQTGVSGASAGSGSSITQALSAIGTTSGSATYSITPLANGCTGTPISVTVTVNPAPVVTATPSSQAICSGSNTGISLSGNVVGTTFSWTVSQTNVSGASAGTGSTITQTLAATTASAGTAVYTITPTANACPGTPINVSITVNPSPVVTATPATQTFCTGGTTGIALTSSVVGTTFSWTVTQSGVTGAGSGSGTTIAQVLNTTGVSAGTAVYTITPTANGCSGSPLNVTINVNPRDNASFTYGSSTYCQTGTNPSPTITGLAGGTFSSSPAGLSINPSTGLINLVGSALNTYTVTYTTGGICPNTSSVNITISSAPSATFSYSGSPFCQYGANPFPTFGAGASAGTFSSSPAGLNFVNVNTGQINLTTSSPGTYTVTNAIAASGGCAAASATFMVTISPAPVATATPASQTICSGTATGIVLSSSLGGTTYSWTITQSGVTGAAAGSGSSISQTLTATGASAGTAVYSITPSSGGCVGLPISVTITVNPTPVATASPNTQTICSGTAPNISLSSTVAGTTFNWTVVQTNVTGASAGSGSSIGQTLTATATTAGTAVYTITPVVSGCTGSPITVTITVNPTPVVTPTPAAQTICSGTATGIALASNVTGATFSWTVIQSGVSGAANGTGTSITQVLSVTGSASGTAVYTITPTANGCAGSPVTVTITVNPSPTAIAAPATQTICSGNAASTSLTSNVAGTTFSWTVSQTGVIGATAGSGSTISQNLTVTGTTAGTAVYTITPLANGCSGTPITFTATVNPAPNVTASPSPQTICSGTATSVSLTSNVAGATFSWTVTSQVGATGATAGSGATIAQVLTVTGSSSGTVVYSVTPLANGCPGAPVSVTVNVNPIPFATTTPASQTICSGASTSINLSSFTSGTTFSWTASNGPGISGASAGSGATISQMLSNSQIIAGQAIYTITPTAGGCSGSPVNVTINVNPTPVMNPASQTICSGAITNIPLTSNVTGTTYSWSTPAQTGASGGSAGSGSPIAQTLTATGAVSGTVTYNVTPSANSCPGTPVNVTVTVDPNPSGTAIPASSTICSGATTSIPLTSNMAGTTYTWTATASGVSGEAGGSGTSINQTLSATGSSAGTVTYNVTATSPAGCSSVLAPVVITVNPIPVVTATASPATICSGSTAVISLTSNVAGTSYNWTVLQTNVTGAAAGSGSSINQVLNNVLPSAGVATYTITPLASGCSSSTPIIVDVNVNPIPTITTSGITQNICNGTSTSITMTSDVAGSTFDWTVTSTGVTGAFAGSGNSISQSLSLTGATAGTVVYSITPTANGCSGTPADVTVTINPIDDPSFNYSASTFCQTGTDPSASITGGASGVFSASPAGLVFLDSLTGLIDVSASAIGNYALTFTTNGICSNSNTINITITTAPDASFSYATPFCQSGMAFPIFGTGASAGIFSANPAGVNFINTTSGQIDLANSSPGTYVITNFIAAAGGCAPSTDTATIVINQAATVNASLDSTICEGVVYTLAGSMGGSTSSIIWSTNGTGTFSDSTNLNSTYTPSAADVTTGIVTLTIISNDPAGVCMQSSDNMALTITPLDNASFSYSGGTFCQSGTDPVASVVGLSGGQFTYTPTGLVIDSSTGLVDLSSSTLGTYAIYYTTNGACPHTDSASLTITTAPDATFTFNSSATAFCQSDANPSPVFSAGASAGAFTVAPSGLTFISSSTGEIDLANSTPGTYTLTNTIVAAGGCASAVDSLVITIDQPATVEAGVAGTICSGNPFIISGDTIGGATSTFLWSSTGSGVFDTTNILHPAYTPSAVDISAGSVTLIISTNDPAGACSSVMDSVILTINQTPVLPTVINPGVYCAGSSVNPISFTGSGGTVNWYSDSTLSTSIGTGNPFTPTTITNTTTIWVTETVGPCVSAITPVTITFNPLPAADTSNVVITGATCGNATGSISNVAVVSGQSPFTYLWQDSLGNNVGDSLNLMNAGPGLYTLTITDANGCTAQVGGSSGLSVTSTSGVTASFTSDFTTGETPLVVNFTNTCTGGVTYLWQFPNNDTASTLNANYTFTQLGLNTVCLIADNGVGCADSICSEIDVYINSVFVIPNIFTPNGDDVNDVFTVKNVGLEKMDAEIYNRWGQKEYEWHTTNGGWDGRTASGVLVPDGTYFFMIRAKGFDGKEYFEKGSFELMR
jgi:gliding motility-associated-like protein